MAQKPNVTPVDFDRCKSVVEFSPELHQVVVTRTHFKSNDLIGCPDTVVLDLRKMDFKTAMEIACALVSSVGVVEYGE